MNQSFHYLVWVTWLTMMLTSMLEVIKGLLPPFLMESLNLNSSQIGFIFSLSFYGVVLANLSCGWLTTKIKPQNLYIYSLYVFSVSSFLLAWFIESYSVWILLFFIMGFSFGIAGVLNNLITPVIFPDKSGKMLGILHFFFGLGSITGPLIVQFTLSYLGFNWNAIFFVYSFAALIFISILHKSSWPIKLGRPLNINISFKNFLNQKLLIVFSLLFFLYVGTEIGFTIWFVSFMTSSYLIEPWIASLLFSGVFTCYTIGRLAGSYVIEKIGYYRGLWYFSLFATVFLFLALFLPGSKGIIFYFFFAFSISIIFPTMTAIATSIFGNKAFLFMGIVFAIGFLGGSLSSWGMGVITDFFSIKTAYEMIFLWFLVFVIFQKAFLHNLSKDEGRR